MTRRHQSVHGANDSGAMRSGLGKVWATDFTPPPRDTSRRTEPDEVAVAKRRAAIEAVVRKSQMVGAGENFRMWRLPEMDATVRKSQMVAEVEATAQSKRERAYGRIESGLTETELMTGYQQEKPMDPDDKRRSLAREITAVINRHNAESGSDTPDYILTEFLLRCLDAFDAATNARGRHLDAKVKP